MFLYQREPWIKSCLTKQSLFIQKEKTLIQSSAWRHENGVSSAGAVPCRETSTGWRETRRVDTGGEQCCSQGPQEGGQSRTVRPPDGCTEVIYLVDGVIFAVVPSKLKSQEKMRDLSSSPETFHLFSIYQCFFFYCLQRGVVLYKTACPLVICSLVDQIGQSSSGPIGHTLKFHLKTDLIYICRTFTLDQCRLLTSPLYPQKRRYLCYYHSCIYICI